MPAQGALVLLGENNAGKSNVLRGLDIVFGDTWPKSRQFEEHDYHGRDSDGIELSVVAEVSGITCPSCLGPVTHFVWRHEKGGVGGGADPMEFLYRHRGCTKSWPDNSLRRSLGYVSIGADRNLDHQLSYRSKYTMLSKLMHRFHERLIADARRKDRLTASFDQLVGLFGEVAEFAEFQRELATLAEELGQNLPYRLAIDFSAYDPSNFFRSLRVQPKLEGEVRSFDELGTGQAQILALAFSCAYAQAFGQAEGTILVIDEPEAHLHPLAQQWLALRLNSMSQRGLQVIVTTHSPHFVDLAHPENLVFVRKPAANTTVTQLTPQQLATSMVASGADASRTTAISVGPFYKASATSEILTGFFARRCVLVEGPTEALALPPLLKLGGLDTLREGVAVIPVGGLGNLAKWFRLFTAFGIPCYSVFDTDSNLTGQKAVQPAAQRADLFAAMGVGIPALTADPLFVAQDYATFDETFEPGVKALLGAPWEALYEESAAVVGEGTKPLRARYAAERLKLADLSGDALAALRHLASAVAPGAVLAIADPEPEGAAPEWVTDGYGEPDYDDPYGWEEPPF